MRRYGDDDPVINQNGVPVNAASVTVRIAATPPASGAVATIYSDNGVTSQANPITTDAYGTYYFYVANGRYDLTFSGGSPAITTRTIADIEIADLAEEVQDAADYPGANAGAKIANAIAALPATGGTVDARGLEGSQTIATDIFTGVTKGVSLLLGGGTFNFSASTTIPNNISILSYQGAVLAPAVATTLTLNGSVFATDNAIIGGAGTVTIGATGVVIKQVGTSQRLFSIFTQNSATIPIVTFRPNGAIELIRPVTAAENGLIVGVTGEAFERWVMTMDTTSAGRTRGLSMSWGSGVDDRTLTVSRNSTSLSTAGTVDVTNGNTAVVGAATAFTADMVGQTFSIDADATRQHKIATFTDATHIGLNTAWGGSTLAGQAYQVATPALSSSQNFELETNNRFLMGKLTTGGTVKLAGVDNSATNTYFYANGIIKVNSSTGVVTTTAGISPTADSQALGEAGKRWALLAMAIDGRRYKASQGNVLQGTDFAISAGWGNTATIGSIRGKDQFHEFIVTSAGAGQGASPTVTLTYRDGTWTTAPIVKVTRQEFANQATVTFTVTTQGATTYVLTFNGTPVAGETYKVSVFIGGI